MTKQELMNKIPLMEQRQDSITDQINDLLDVATKLGMYDARDWLRSTFYGKEDNSRTMGKSNTVLYNEAVKATEDYLLASGWIKDNRSLLWCKQNQNQFYHHDAFKVQVNIDFGN